MTRYSIRSLYEISGEGPAVAFAERIVCFDDSENLLDAALKEIDGFLQLNPHYRRVGELAVYELSRSIDSCGEEVWCMLYEAKSASDFVLPRQQFLPAEEQ